MSGRRVATLPEIEQLREYQRQLTTMIGHVDPKLREALNAELVMVEEQISKLRLKFGGKWPGKAVVKARSLW